MGREWFKRLFGKSKKNESKIEDEPAKAVAVSAPLQMPINANSTIEKDKDLYLKVSFATDVGKRRANNEDNFYIDCKYRHNYGKNECDSYIELTTETHLYSVFDGMGGEAFGETASALAAARMEGMTDIFRTAASSDLPYYMNEYTRAANDAICDMCAERGSRGGSTFAAVCVKDGQAYPFYIGDSRIYLYDEGTLLQITEDQTLAVRKIKAGVYTADEAENSPDHHRLTSFLGADSGGMGLDPQPCMPVPAKAGVKLLICSDGLTDMCSREEIAQMLSQTADCKNAARVLAEKALKNGGMDNVTCIVLEFEELFGGINEDDCDIEEKE